LERFNLKKLNDVEGKEQFRAEVSNRFAALEDLDAEVEIEGLFVITIYYYYYYYYYLATN
jgi:hypothetical protein